MTTRTQPGSDLARSLAGAHAQSLALIAPVVASVRPDQLDLPTPCADWKLRKLLEHVIGQQYGFAAAARGDGADLAVWADRPLEPGPGAGFAALAGFAQSAGDLVAGFAQAAEQGVTFALPELREGYAFPAEQAIGFHLLDTLVHGWDIARAIGAPFDCPPELAGLLLLVSERVPAKAEDRKPGAAFAPVLENGLPEPTSFERALALLGRAPDWTPPQG